MIEERIASFTYKHKQGVIWGMGIANSLLIVLGLVLAATGFWIWAIVPVAAAFGERFALTLMLSKLVSDIPSPTQMAAMSDELIAFLGMDEKQINEMAETILKGFQVKQ
jgi:hypothetical protein